MYKVYKGETVEEALQNGLNELQVTEDDISIDVLESGSKGFLGLGKKEAQVKLTIINPELKKFDSIEALEARPYETKSLNEASKEDFKAPLKEKDTHIEESSNVREQTDIQKPTFTLDEAAESTAQYVQKVVMEMGIHNTAKYEILDREIIINIESDITAKLIGKRGSTLNALQEIAQHYFNKIQKSYGRIILDAENYRNKRKETLENLAINMSKKAVRTNLPVHLEPMPAFERKIIHNALSNVTNIHTYSSGEEPNRHIVIEKE